MHHLVVLELQKFSPDEGRNDATLTAPNKKKMDEKKRDELLNNKKKTKPAGFASPVDNPFNEGGALGGFGAGGGASYRPSGGMRRQGGGG